MARLRRTMIAVAAGTLLALGLPGGMAQSASEPPRHAAITISTNADFATCACVTGGSGTASDPYVIGPWTIPAESAGGWALKVDNSSGAVTAYFRVAGIVTTYNDLDTAHSVVWIVKVTRQTSIENVTASFDGVGIRLDSDANVSLNGLELNRLEGDGVQVNSSTNISIVNSKLKTEQSGFHAENSSFIQIGVGCKSACNDWTYDNWRGVWLHNTHDVTARYLTTAAEDTTAMYLDGSYTYNVDIGNSTANSSGSICETGHVGATGLVTDTDGGIRLVNGAHDNYIHDVTAHGNVAMDIASGGDGFWLNPCTGLQVPISPTTAGMGGGNRFANLCYSLTNIPTLPPSTCKT